MILGSDKYLADIDLATLPPIVIDDSVLECVSQEKNLGVTISQTLDFQAHTRQISLNIFSGLFTLRFFRDSLSKALRIHLMQTLILPHFDYASPCTFTLMKHEIANYRSRKTPACTLST